MKTSFLSAQRINELYFTIMVLLCAGLVGFLSLHYRIHTDWTARGQNSLSDNSKSVLQNLDKPVTVTAYVTPDKRLTTEIHRFIAQYTRVKKNLGLNFVNPDLNPELGKALGLTVDGELVIEYDGRSENVRNLSETEITNALHRLAYPDERWVVFVSGHGERSPTGRKNHDLGQFGVELKNKGLKLLELDLATTKSIPDNTDVLVLAGAESPLDADEIAIISDYVNRGGNLLWLQDPGDLYGLDSLAVQLGIQFLSGIVVDGSSRAHGVNDPSFLTSESYPEHDITSRFSSITLFPKASAIDTALSNLYEVGTIVRSSQQSWTENGPIQGAIQFDENTSETQGPLAIAVSLSARLTSPAEIRQRIVIVGDEDFLANRYIANGDNLELGTRIVQWLVNSDRFVSIPVRDTADRRLEMSPIALSVVSFTFLIIFPFVLIAGGLFFSYRRKSL